MGDATTETVRRILAGFVSDPPDSDFQQGYLAAVLTIANEVLGIHATDPLWAQADALLGGANPAYVAAIREQAEKKRAPFTVIDGGKIIP
jgi:hypothetical protein